MDLLKPATAGALALLSGCLDPFAPSTPEAPSTRTTRFATSPQQVPQRFGEALQERNPELLGGLLGGQVTLSAPPLDDQKQEGVRLCVQRLVSTDPQSQLRWWNSNPTSTGTTFGSSDTVEVTLEYRLERLSADRSKTDILAQEEKSKWTLHRANPSEWRLVSWEDPSDGTSFLKLCGNPR